MERSPLVESLLILSNKPNKSVVFFYAVLFSIFILIAGINCSPQFQRMAMRKFHFIPRPFTQWALGQFFPSMYAFRNEILISPQYLPSDYQGLLTNGSVNMTVNHYPLRMLYFAVPREQIFAHAPFYVYIRTVFRRQEIVSTYRVTGLGQTIHITFVNSYERSSQ